MEKDKQINYSEVFKSLSIKPRLDIVVFVSKNPYSSVTEIADALKMGIANVSIHLSHLKSADVLLEKKKGTSVLHSINEEVLEKCQFFLSGLLGLPEQSGKDELFALRQIERLLTGRLERIHNRIKLREVLDSI